MSAGPSGNGAAASEASLLAWIAAARAWIFLIFLVVFFEVWAQSTYGNSFIFNTFTLRAIGMAAVVPLLLALGQTLVIISGGIDLSVGFTMGLAAVTAATIIRDFSPIVGLELALLFGIVAGLLGVAIPGLINGLLIGRLRIPPFIGTLGMFGVARGIGYLIADGTTVPARNEQLTWLGNGLIFGIPVPVIITAFVVLGFHLLLSQTRFGQYTYAIGGNPQAAKRAGINVKRHIMWLYVLSAVSAGLAGLVYTARFSAGAPHAGEPILLNSIAAVVIGGASLFGGSGTIIGTVIGALIIAVIEFGLVFMDMEPFWQFIAVGLVIIISVLVDQAQKPRNHEDG